MKKVCVFTGSRANYSSCKPIMRAISNHPEIELQVVLGAAAILDRYGNIESLLEEDGFKVDAKFYMIIEGENPTTMAKSTGLGLIEAATIFDNLKPDYVLVVGDRFDIMAPAIAATYMNIPLIHTMGGEVSGTIDESIRHAITKLAQVHFPANEDARARILRMGEKPSLVFNHGCPRIDLVSEIIAKHRNGPRLNSKKFFSSFKGVGGSFDLLNEKFLLVSQHPVTTEYGSNRKQFNATLEALHILKMPTIMLWPNADAGNDEISKAIRTFREKYVPNWLHMFKNLPIREYTILMDLCACMIGNSSSAVREGTFIGTPAVNIGSRQNSRLKGSNIIDVDYDADEIVRAVKTQLNNNERKSDSLYGDGTASKRIAETIASLKDLKVQKTICY